MRGIAPAARSLLMVATLAALGSRAWAAPVVADIDSPDKRRLAVDIAERLAKEPQVPDPVDLPPSPFVAADGERIGDKSKGSDSGSSKQAESLSDSQILDRIAARIEPSGTIFVSGQPMLMFGKKFVKVGTHFTVTYNGSDYDLVLTYIDRTSFTLRLNREETTRPILTGKSQ